MARAVAITGGIGSGKSQLRAILERLGYVCCNADILSREIFEFEDVRNQIKAAFGKKAFDAAGEFDRQYIRDLVFADESRRKELEAITHPAIANLFSSKMKSLTALSPNAWMFYEAAVILESKRHSDFDAVVLVTASEDIRLARLASNRGMDGALARKIMATQMPEGEKAKFADFVIDNSGDLSTLETKAIELVRYLEKKFS